MTTSVLSQSTTLNLEYLSVIYKCCLDKHSIVALTDLKGVIIEVNDKFCEISGYEKDELIGKTHKVVSSGYHSKSFWQNMWMTLKKGCVFRADIKNKKKNGDYYWVDTFIYPVEDMQGNIVSYFTIRNDITERIEKHAKYLEQLKEYKFKLENFNHDLKNDFTVLAWSFRNYKKTKDEKSADRVEKKLENIINKTLLISEFKKDDIDFVKNGEKLIESIIDEFSDECKNKEIDLTLVSEVKDYAWDIGINDFRSILVNLIRNSIESLASKIDGKKISLYIYGSNKNPVIEIYDTGNIKEGVSVDKLFQKGFSTKQGTKNSGLGLFSCKRTLNNYNFDIILNSLQDGVLISIMQL